MLVQVPLGPHGGLDFVPQIHLQFLGSLVVKGVQGREDRLLLLLRVGPQKVQGVGAQHGEQRFIVDLGGAETLISSSAQAISA